MSTNDPENIYPIGAVISFAGSALDDEAWVPCDGRSLPIDEYELLYAALGDTYGADPSAGTFDVPDYVGRFLRGAQSRADVGRFEAWTTAAPNAPFMGEFPNVPTETFNAETRLQTSAARPDPDEPDRLPTCTGGGDPETRPVNVYVTRFIRAR